VVGGGWFQCCCCCCCWQRQQDKACSSSWCDIWIRAFQLWWFSFIWLLHLLLHMGGWEGWGES
jgi:hypothetical protein